MKQILNKLMWCSAAVLSFGTINAMNDVQPAAVEVDSGSDLTPVPQTDVIQAGSFSTDPQIYDMVCTGKCELNQRDLEVIVTPAKKAPSLVKIGEGNTVVYAKPEPMAAVHVPNGHDGWVQVRLTNLQNNSSAENRFSLGVRKQGDESSLIRLYTPNSDAGSINDTGTHIANIPAASNEIWELVPLLTEGSAADENYKAVEENQNVSLGADVNSFDFGSVYRVNINYSLWRMDTCNLNSITHEGEWYISSQPGIFEEKSQLLAVDKKGRLASSEDGVNWVAAGSIYNGTDTAADGWSIAPVYGKDMWCIVNKTSGEVRYKPQNSSHWFDRGMTISGALDIAYGNGIFVILTSNEVNDKRVAYVSEDTQYWKRIGDFPVGETVSYVNNTWIVALHGGNYTDDCQYYCSIRNCNINSEKWEWSSLIKPVSTDLSRWSWIAFCQMGDNFTYALASLREATVLNDIYRSNDLKNPESWTHITSLPTGELQTAFFNNNQLHVVGKNHTHRGYIK